MPGSQEDTLQGQVGVSQYQDTGAASSEAVLRMPKKPAIELVDARVLSLHSLFALLTTIGMSFAAAVWTAYATTDASGWLLASAAILTALSLVFLGLAIAEIGRAHV